MLGRMAALAALAMVAACGSVQSAGRNARDSAPAAPPPAAAPAPAPQQAPAPNVAAPDVSVATPAPAPQQTQGRSGGGGDIVVPGQVERQVPVPDGDPRSTAERMADIRAWDRCVMQVQGQASADPMRPQLEMPEDFCREELGMADRTAVPARRQ